ncbi:uncharacterized protein LOC128298306 [Anopheles moucheti]|uniref:uncharacterized protein LOC128298306 n=1 Tax=Anopheles moucheti TaxID=186751 RepID=UPI0022F028C6|nr:uncharacterized protein LOC128298306 [Anopheles moucheti]
MSGTRRTSKPIKQFKISRKKLNRALEKLNNLPKIIPHSPGFFSNCNTNIIKQLNTSAHVQPISWKQNWLKLFATSITSHDWDTFIKTLRLASQNHNNCGLDNVLRNCFFGVLTHPIYRDEETLRLLLYTIAPCRNEYDIEFCIETILRTFDGKYTFT